MSNRYKGGVISATPPTTTGGNDGVASGAWTLEQQMQAQAAGLWPNQPVFYIEDVFSTYLYTGNGGGSATGFYGTQTITNGVDLSTKGGLVWLKARSSAEAHALFDTARGVNKILRSDYTFAQSTAVNTVTAFNTTGFNLGSDSDGYGTNTNAVTYASWTFRKQPKFFDVVTWTGDGSTTRELPHSLASLPGFIIIKRTNGNGGWETFARDNSNNFNRLFLNTTGSVFWVTAQTNIASSTNLNVGYLQANLGSLNVSGETYVAYLFAHNAGGFGLTGTDNVISCGSYTGTGATGNAITLGYEAQWVMVKRTDTTGDWEIMDAMRSGFLEANTSDAESGGSWFSLSGDNFFPTATGFQINTAGPAWNASGGTYIYIAIRRGPMKVPTSGTSVFSPATRTGNDTSSSSTAGFPVDLGLTANRGAVAWKFAAADRLRGATFLRTAGTNAEGNPNTEYTASSFASNTQLTLNGSSDIVNANANTYIDLMFRRAPSFFDEVCYTGTGSARTINHNLTVAPELVIIKSRSNAVDWVVGNTSLGFANFLMLNRNDASGSTSSIFNNTAPTASVFSVGASSGTNEVTLTYVAYLFATLAGVSKVGSYTGTATTKQIDCGFTGGARFVLIKRTDSTGDWYVWDSARGIVAGNDPYLLLNSTAAEVTNTDYVDTYSAGFEISSTAPAAINANGGSFIFLAIS